MNQSTNIQNIPPILKGNGIPEYKEITPEEINKYIPTLLEELINEFEDIEKRLQTKLDQNSLLSWEEVMTPIHTLSERLRWSWGVICHLNAVCNTSQLRDAHANQQPGIVRLSNRIGQSKILYNALSSLKDKSLQKLDQTQIRIIDSELLSMNQRGVGLTGESQKEFNSDSERLAQLSSSFSNNVLDATKEWGLLITNKSDVEGLPLRALEILADAAKQAGDLGKDDNNNLPTAEEGPWKLGLDLPRYMPFMTYGTNRVLRETLYKAHVSRASSGNLSNQKLLEEILNLRNAQAKRLGHNNWAELSLSSKMAKDVAEVEELLEELRSAAMPAAKKEIKELQDCAERNQAEEASNFAPWDISFWSERLRQERFDLNQEALRPWFPFPQVLEGLFKLCENLFEINIQPADGDAPIWHKDVRFFKVLNKQGTPIAYFYLDPYSRPINKRGGAWMDECLGKSKSQNGKPVLPVAYLICNQTPSTKNQPSLMSFEEVETLFHEFGHGLQHMLTKVDYPQAAGINNVEWDAVELPSQFMENWCLDRETLMGMARHWQTGELLAEKDFQKLRSSRTFNSGLSTLRQIHFALTDIRLHSEWSSELGITPDDFRRKIAKNTTVLAPIKEDQFLCAFSHIFAGGYSAGYYSYKWAEVLSADAYAAFEEVSKDNRDELKSIGKRFRDTVLSLGGSRPPQEIFKAFRGRVANTEALIRHSGLKENHQALP